MCPCQSSGLPVHFTVGVGVQSLDTVRFEKIFELRQKNQKVFIWLNS